ncbi:hypothetical protein ACVNIS_14055 [Sphaerotilaceae bacterium SBD11-9]
MSKLTLMIAMLLAALAGSAQAQAPAAEADPAVQMRLEKKEVDKTFSEKKKALNSERMTKVKAAGDTAAAEAQAKGKEPGIARRDAEARVKAATKAEHDTKMKALKKEHDAAVAALKKKYPAAKS